MVLWLLLVPILGFGLSDLVLLEGHPVLPWVWLLRVVVVAFTLLVVWRLRRRLDVVAYDRLLAVWAGVIALTFLTINFTRPPTYLPIYVLDVLVPLGAYLVFPVSLRVQTLGALGFTLGEVVLWFVVKALPLDVTGQLSIAAAFLIANVFGFVVSRRLHEIRRLHFVLARHEGNLVRELEAALATVDELQGILPICTFCKKIRKDDGYYEEVDRFISRHANVQISHSLCPACASERYPDFFPADGDSENGEVGEETDP